MDSMDAKGVRLVSTASRGEQRQRSALLFFLLFWSPGKRSRNLFDALRRRQMPFNEWNRAAVRSFKSIPAAALTFQRRGKRQHQLHWVSSKYLLEKKSSFLDQSEAIFHSARKVFEDFWKKNDYKHGSWWIARLPWNRIMFHWILSKMISIVRHLSKTAPFIFRSIQGERH